MTLNVPNVQKKHTLLSLVFLQATQLIALLETLCPPTWWTPTAGSTPPSRKIRQFSIQRAKEFFYEDLLIALMTQFTNQRMKQVFFYKNLLNALMTQSEKQSCGWGWQRSRPPRGCSSGRRSGKYQVVFLLSLFSVFVLFELFLFSLSGTTNITSGFASHSTFKQSSSTYPGFKWSDWR